MLPGTASKTSTRQFLAMLTLGFASGLPYALIRDPLKAWMTQRNFSVVDIGSLSVLAWPATLKFVWAPAMDRFVPPLLGRRRGWLVVTQLLLVLSIFALGQTAGRGSLDRIILFGFVLAFLGASQDIAGDAYRTDVLTTSTRGVGNSIWVIAYRLALISSGAGSLYAVGKYHLAWSTVYSLIAGLMGFSLIATFVVSAEPPSMHPPQSLKDAVLMPLLDLCRRRGGPVLLAFVFLFKVPEMLAASLTQTFMQRLGIPIEEIGRIKNGLGLGVAIFGVLIGGIVVTRIGIRNALWICGLLGAASNLGFWVLARAGPDRGIMVGSVCVESFCAGMVAAAFVSYLTSQCDHTFSATQYAILSGIAAASEPLLAPAASKFAGAFGWQRFFIASALAGVPSLLLLLMMPRQAARTIDAPAIAPNS